jgi:hypothetical protein
MATDAAWRNRITRHADVPPAELVAHPLNARRHPKHQADALSGVLAEVGVVQSVIVNERTGRMLDGSSSEGRDGRLPVLDEVVTRHAERDEVVERVGSLPIAAEGPSRDQVMDVEVSLSRGPRAAHSAPPAVAEHGRSPLAFPVGSVLALTPDAAGIGRIVGADDVARSACGAAVEAPVDSRPRRVDEQWGGAAGALDRHPHARCCAVGGAEAGERAEGPSALLAARLDPERRAAVAAREVSLGESGTLGAVAALAACDESEAVKAPACHGDSRTTLGAGRADQGASAAVALPVPLLLAIAARGDWLAATACAA